MKSRPAEADGVRQRGDSPAAGGDPGSDAQTLPKGQDRASPIDASAPSLDAAADTAVKPINAYLKELRRVGQPSKKLLGLTRKGSIRIYTVVRAAGRVFLEQGYAKFTMRRVAARAGLALGTLTYYFKDKNELLSAMYKHYYIAYARRVAKALSAASTDPRERLDAILDFFVEDRISGTSGEFDLELWAYARGNPPTRQIMTDSLEVTRRIFAGVIVEVNPGLSSADALRVATVVASLIDSLAFAVVPHHERPASGRHIEADFKAVARNLVATGALPPTSYVVT